MPKQNNALAKICLRHLKIKLFPKMHEINCCRLRFIFIVDVPAPLTIYEPITYLNMLDMVEAILIIMLFSNIVCNLL